MKYLILILSFFFLTIQAQIPDKVVKNNFIELLEETDYISTTISNGDAIISNEKGIFEFWKDSKNNLDVISLRFTTNSDYFLEATIETDTKKGVNTSIITSMDGYIKFEQFMNNDKAGNKIPTNITTNLFSVKRSKEFPELMEKGIHIDDLEDFMINNFVFKNENSHKFLDTLSMLEHSDTKDACTYIGAGTGLALGVYINCAVCAGTGGWGALACGTCIAELLGAGISVAAFFSECFPDMPDYDPTLPIYDENNPPAPGSGDPGHIGGNGGMGLIAIPVWGTATVCVEGGTCVSTPYIKYWIILRD